MVKVRQSNLSVQILHTLMFLLLAASAIAAPPRTVRVSGALYLPNGTLAPSTSTAKTKLYIKLVPGTVDTGNNVIMTESLTTHVVDDTSNVTIDLVPNTYADITPGGSYYDVEVAVPGIPSYKQKWVVPCTDSGGSCVAVNLADVVVSGTPTPILVQVKENNTSIGNARTLNIITTSTTNEADVASNTLTITLTGATTSVTSASPLTGDGTVATPFDIGLAAPISDVSGNVSLGYDGKTLTLDGSSNLDLLFGNNEAEKALESNSNRLLTATQLTDLTDAGTTDLHGHTSSSPLSGTGTSGSPFDIGLSQPLTDNSGNVSVNYDGNQFTLDGSSRLDILAGGIGNNELNPSALSITTPLTGNGVTTPLDLSIGAGLEESGGSIRAALSVASPLSGTGGATALDIGLAVPLLDASGNVSLGYDGKSLTLDGSNNLDIQFGSNEADKALESNSNRLLTSTQVTDLTDAGTTDLHGHTSASPLSGTGTSGSPFDIGLSAPLTDNSGNVSVGYDGNTLTLDGSSRLDLTFGNNEADKALESNSNRLLTVTQLTDLTDSGETTLHKHAVGLDLTGTTDSATVSNANGTKIAYPGGDSDSGVETVGPWALGKTLVWTNRLGVAQLEPTYPVSVSANGNTAQAVPSIDVSGRVVGLSVASNVATFSVSPTTFLDDVGGSVGQSDYIEAGENVTVTIDSRGVAVFSAAAGGGGGGSVTSVTAGAGQVNSGTANDPVLDVGALAPLAANSDDVSLTMDTEAGVVVDAQGRLSLDTQKVTHNGLGGLDTGDYRHLSATNYTDLTDAGDSALHFHATDRARANHTGTQTRSTISDFAHGPTTHQDGQADEFSLEGLSGLLAQTQRVSTSFNLGPYVAAKELDFTINDPLTTVYQATNDADGTTINVTLDITSIEGLSGILAQTQRVTTSVNGANDLATGHIAAWEGTAVNLQRGVTSDTVDITVDVDLGTGATQAAAGNHTHNYPVDGVVVPLVLTSDNVSLTYDSNFFTLDGSSQLILRDEGVTNAKLNPSALSITTPLTGNGVSTALDISIGAGLEESGGSIRANLSVASPLSGTGGASALDIGLASPIVDASGNVSLGYDGNSLTLDGSSNLDLIFGSNEANKALESNSNRLLTSTQVTDLTDGGATDLHAHTSASPLSGTGTSGSPFDIGLSAPLSDNSGNVSLGYDGNTLTLDGSSNLDLTFGDNEANKALESNSNRLLTSTQVTDLTDSGDTSLHKHTVGYDLAGDTTTPTVSRIEGNEVAYHGGDSNSGTDNIRPWQNGMTYISSDRFGTRQLEPTFPVTVTDADTGTTQALHTLKVSGSAADITIANNEATLSVSGTTVKVAGDVIGTVDHIDFKTGFTGVVANGSAEITSTGTGDVVGPASSTNEAMALFDGTTGKLLKNGAVTATVAGAVNGVTTLDADDTVSAPQFTDETAGTYTGDNITSQAQYDIFMFDGTGWGRKAKGANNTFFRVSNSGVVDYAAISVASNITGDGINTALTVASETPTGTWSSATAGDISDHVHPTQVILQDEGGNDGAMDTFNVSSAAANLTRSSDVGTLAVIPMVLQDEGGNAGHITTTNVSSSIAAATYSSLVGTIGIEPLILQDEGGNVQHVTTFNVSSVMAAATNSGLVGTVAITPLVTQDEAGNVAHATTVNVSSAIADMTASGLTSTIAVSPLVLQDEGGNVQHVNTVNVSSAVAAATNSSLVGTVTITPPRVQSGGGNAGYITDGINFSTGLSATNSNGLVTVTTTGGGTDGVAKAWAKFTNDGTVVDSFNVASVTDNGKNSWSPQISTDFANDDYAVAATVESAGGDGTNGQAIAVVLSQAVGSFNVQAGGTLSSATGPTTFYNGGISHTEPTGVHFAAFGDQ